MIPPRGPARGDHDAWWRKTRMVFGLWSTAAVAAQLASYRAVEGAPTPGDRRVVAIGIDHGRPSFRAAQASFCEIYANWGTPGRGH
ncbi:MAG: hypothetical protein OEY23_05645 [Acidimicrobiia bacterium]|nr:hypothetical protein [Acidimicrobiia bacterium]